MKKFHVFAVFITMGLTPCWCQTRPDHSLLDTPAVHAQMNKLYIQATPTFMRGGPRVEHSFTVNADGSVQPIESSNSTQTNTVTVPAGTQAIIHTHPNGTLPSPGPSDIPAAKAAHCPNYELSRDQLWVANPDGTTAKVGDVEMKHGELVIK